MKAPDTGPFLIKNTDGWKKVDEPFLVVITVERQKSWCLVDRRRKSTEEHSSKAQQLYKIKVLPILICLSALEPDLAYPINLF